MNKDKSLVARILSSLRSLFVREKLGVLEEEAILTPGRIVIKNYLSNRLGIIGLAGFILIFIFSFGGSKIYPMVDSYTELANMNIRPGSNYIKYPKELKNKKVAGITSGVSFSYAYDEDGNSYIWGTECNDVLPGVSNYILDIPKEVQEANIVAAAAGGRHILAMDDEGNIYGWGYYGSGQTEVPDDIQKIFTDRGIKPKQIIASSSWSAILGSNNELYVWGSTNAKMTFMISSRIQGSIEKVAAGDSNMALLLDDGNVAVIGDKGTEYKLNIPEEIKEGSVKIVDIVSTNRNVLALDSDGKLHTWGSNQDGLNNPPMYEGKGIALEAGYKHFILMLDSGEVVSWGANDLHQLDEPEDIASFHTIYSDYFQNYGLDENGHIVATWGNKGYVFGSDQYGRDMLNRLIHGGKISLTVGAVAMIISTIIALIVGLVAGYFGGWIDMALMRLADIITAIPLLPLAVTLSYALGDKLNQQQRIYMIMVILGILSWTGLARLIRAQLLLEREKDFVLAARALGIKQSNIMAKHILPNIFNLVIVNITTGYAASLLTEAGLSFLGFGVTEPTPSWGNMLTSAQQSTIVEYYWWRWFIPALFVVMAALFVNMIGDALREAMDPRANER